MQVTLQPLLASEGESVEIQTNPTAIVSSLISSYCAQKGVQFHGKYVIYDEKKRVLPLYTTLSTLGIENGQTLLIGKDDSSFSVAKQWPIIVAFATLAIGLIGILTISLVYSLKGGEYFDDYGVVMDAGSSKTNTIVYKWRSSKHKGTGCVSQEDNCYAKGGIAKMNPMHLDPVINCAINVTSVIEPSSLPKTPLYFAATAGMRLLNLTNPTKEKEILNRLRINLTETGLDVQVVEVISGRDEGIYGWITSNFLQKTLESPQKLNPWEPTTYGALDMGGASLQISYALPEYNSSSPNMIQLQLYGQPFNIFSHSNLCFGRDEAQNRYNTLLFSGKILPNDVIEDPCAPLGFSTNITANKLFEPICAKYSAENLSILHQEILKQNRVLTFTGTSNPDSCHDAVSRLLDEELCLRYKFKECFKKYSDLPDNQKFLAFATYYYTTHFLKIENTTLENYEKTIRDFCLKNLKEVQQMTNESYGVQYCFNAQYIHEVLLNGFGFSNSTWKNLEFVGAIAGKDVGWTLGYMINATNIIPIKATPRLISTAGLTVSLVLFIIVIASTALFLLFTFKNANRT